MTWTNTRGVGEAREGGLLSSPHDLQDQRLIAMLIRLFKPSSPIQVDAKGLALIAACESLSKGPTTLDGLWPGEDEHDLPS